MTLLLVLSILLNALLFAGLVAAAYYIWKFSQIIMILEDDFADAIDSLESVEASLEKILSMQLFFDSKEVKMVVQESMAELKAGRIAVNRLIQTFVQRSKQKYVVVQEETMPPPPSNNRSDMDVSDIEKMMMQR